MKTATKIKKAPYMGWLYLGDTMVDIHGYDGDPHEVYITDTDIDVSEMIHYLGGWEKFAKDADEAHYRYKTNS